MNLLGRNWLSKVKLGWVTFFNRYKEKLNNTFKTYDISAKLVNLVQNYNEL